MISEEHYYKYCLENDIPYFGSIMRAFQGEVKRHSVMQLLLKQECQDQAPFEILEIGSWAGGSAITWADALRRFNQSKGTITCIDSWTPYFNLEETYDPALGRNYRDVYEEMEQALRNEEIYNLFKHNIKASGHVDIIKSIIGKSEEILPSLTASSFDLIFVDGNHSYDFIKNDLVHCKRLVKEGGVICGDDLELQAFEVDVEAAWKRRNEDYMLNLSCNRFFHPGVTLAVHEAFGEVSSWHGFWAVRKCQGNWGKIQLPIHNQPEEMSIPFHLIEPERLRRKLRQAEENLKQLSSGFPEPILVEAYNGYNIVAWRGVYYGIPQKLGEFDLASKDISRLDDVLLERTPSRLKELIRKIHSPAEL